MSKKQSIVALSSTEAEYISTSTAIQEAIHLRKLLSDLGHTQKHPTTIYVDNQGAIKIANNPIANRRTKHIDVRYHYTREKIEQKEIKLEYLPTTEMLADILTKPVGKNIHRKLVPRITGDSRLRGGIRTWKDSYWEQS